MMTILLDITGISKEFIDTLNSLKIYVITGMFLISVGYAAWQAQVGGHDKRTIINTLVGVMIVAILIFSADKIILWLARIAG
jgi:hypothetical protein